MGTVHSSTSPYIPQTKAKTKYRKVIINNSTPQGLGPGTNATLPRIPRNRFTFQICSINTHGSGHPSTLHPHGLWPESAQREGAIVCCLQPIWSAAGRGAHWQFCQNAA